MVWFVLGLMTLVGVIVWLKWLGNAEPAAVKRSVFYASALLLLLATLLLIGTGKLPAAFGTATLAFVVYQRYRQLKGLWNIYSSWSSARGARPTGGGTGQASVVETEWLRMTLNHDTGELAGEVLKGGFAGRVLSELGEAELAALYQELRDADGESARLLEAYLDRVMGGESRTDAGSGDSGPATGAPQMTEDEALGILGLSKGVDAATIRDAHKRLIKKLHPDLGGSDYLAAKINEAKEFLLRRRGEG